MAAVTGLMEFVFDTRHRVVVVGVLVNNTFLAKFAVERLADDADANIMKYLCVS